MKYNQTRYDLSLSFKNISNFDKTLVEWKIIEKTITIKYNNLVLTSIELFDYIYNDLNWYYLDEKLIFELNKINPIFWPNLDADGKYTFNGSNYEEDFHRLPGNLKEEYIKEIKNKEIFKSK